MSIDKLVAHFHDIIQTELRSRMRIQHSGLVNRLPLSASCGLNGKQLHIDIRHVHSRQLYRESSHMAGVNPVAVYEAGHLHAGIIRKIFDTAMVDHIASDLIGLALRDSLHDIRRIFAAALMSDLSVLQDLIPLLLPSLDLIDASSRILVQGNIIPLNQFGIFRFYEKAVVLRIVLAGFRTVIAQPLKICLLYTSDAADD